MISGRAVFLSILRRFVMLAVSTLPCNLDQRRNLNNEGTKWDGCPDSIPHSNRRRAAGKLKSCCRVAFGPAFRTGKRAG